MYIDKGGCTSPIYFQWFATQTNPSRFRKGFCHACNDIHICEEGYHGAKPHLLINISSWAKVVGVSWNGARESIGLHQKIIILPILI